MEFFGEIMNHKRYFVATIGLFVFIFLYEMIIHGFILMKLYETTASTWRDFTEMEANMPLSICFQMAFSAWVTYIYSQFYKEGNIKDGLRFGLFLGGFAGILTASWYLWLPVPAQLGILWFIFAIFEGIGGGYVLGLLYRHSKQQDGY